MERIGKLQGGKQQRCREGSIEVIEATALTTTKKAQNRKNKKLQYVMSKEQPIMEGTVQSTTI